MSALSFSLIYLATALVIALVGDRIVALTNNLERS